MMTEQQIKEKIAECIKIRDEYYHKSIKHGKNQLSSDEYQIYKTYSGKVEAYQDVLNG